MYLVVERLNKGAEGEGIAKVTKEKTNASTECRAERAADSLFRPGQNGGHAALEGRWSLRSFYSDAEEVTRAGRDVRQRLQLPFAAREPASGRVVPKGVKGSSCIRHSAQLFSQFQLHAVLVLTDFFFPSKRVSCAGPV